MLVWKKKKVILGYDFVLEKREKGMKPKKLVCLFRDASGSWRTTSEALGTYWTYFADSTVSEDSAKQMVEQLVKNALSNGS